MSLDLSRANPKFAEWFQAQHRRTQRALIQQHGKHREHPDHAPHSRNADYHLLTLLIHHAADHFGYRP